MKGSKAILAVCACAGFVLGTSAFAPATPWLRQALSSASVSAPTCFETRLQMSGQGSESAKPKQEDIDVLVEEGMSEKDAIRLLSEGKSVKEVITSPWPCPSQTCCLSPSSVCCARDAFIVAHEVPIKFRLRNQCLEPNSGRCTKWICEALVN